MNDLTKQGEDPFYFFFGAKFFDLGVRSKDRDVNRRIKIFKSWASAIVQKRIKEIQELK